MTVSELINELKQMPQDANVATVTDWDNPDEQGNLPTRQIIGIDTQVYVDVNGFGDDEETEVIMLA